MGYKHYLKSLHWKEFRKDYFKRYDRVCSVCGSKNQVQLHHKTYSKLWHEEFTDVVALCKICHSIEHGHFKQILKLKRKRPEMWSMAIKKAKRALKLNARKYRVY